MEETTKQLIEMLALPGGDRRVIEKLVKKGIPEPMASQMVEVLKDGISFTN